MRNNFRNQQGVFQLQLLHLQNYLYSLKIQLKRYLFQVPIITNQSPRLMISDLQQNNLQSFDKMIFYPQLAIVHYYDGMLGFPYLKEELNNSFVISLITFILQFIYLITYDNLDQIIQMDSVFYFQLIIITILNLISSVIKYILIQKIQQNQRTDNNEISRFLILLFLSRIYQFNIKLCKLMNLAYFSFSFRIWQLKQKFQNQYLNLGFALVFIFYLRVILSFIKYQIQFCSQKISRLSGLTDQQLYSLKTLNWNNSLLCQFNNQNTCSICFETFKNEQSIMVLACSGQHIFHQMCVQRWLIFKKTCPNCNTLAIGKQSSISKTS